MARGWYDRNYLVGRKPHGPLKVEVGQRVIWAKYFLKSIGEGPTSDAWREVGTVSAVDADGVFASILWDGRQEPSRVNTGNLAFPGANIRAQD